MSRFGSKAAAGCAALFLLPFAAVGAFTAARAVAMAQTGIWRDAALYGVFALVFGGVGFGGLQACATATSR